MLATLQNEPDSQEQTINQPGEGENGRRLERVGAIGMWIGPAGGSGWKKKEVFTLLMRRRGNQASGS